jgi:hypothetical protein
VRPGRVGLEGGRPVAREAGGISRHAIPSDTPAPNVLPLRRGKLADASSSKQGGEGSSGSKVSLAGISLAFLQLLASATMSTMVESPMDASGASALSMASLQLGSPAKASLRAPGKAPRSDKEITVMLSVRQPDGEQTELIHVLADETIRDVKLRLSRSAWFTNGHSKLVFGDRELLEHETVSQLLRVDDTASSHLHILVAMNAIENVAISTSARQELSAGAGGAPGTPRTPVKSALTTSLSGGQAEGGARCGSFAHAARRQRGRLPRARRRPPAARRAPGSTRWDAINDAAAPAAPCCCCCCCCCRAQPSRPHRPPPRPAPRPRSLVPASKAVAPFDASADLASRTVVHLVVSKTAKVNWRHLKDDSFELSVSAADTVESLKRRISSVDSDIELDSVDLVYGGQVRWRR